MILDIVILTLYNEVMPAMFISWSWPLLTTLVIVVAATLQVIVYDPSTAYYGGGVIFSVRLVALPTQLEILFIFMNTLVF